MLLLDMTDPSRGLVRAAAAPRVEAGAAGPGRFVLDVPGVARDGLKVTRAGRTVTVEAVRSWPEGRSGRTVRTLMLPAGAGELSATLRDGTLVIEFAAPEEEVPVEVPVG